MEGKWKPEEKRVSSLTALSLLLEYTSGTTLLGWKLSFSFSNELTRCSLFPLILRFFFMSFCLYLSVSLSLSLSPSVSVLCCFLSTTTNGRRKWKGMESRSRKKKTSVPLLCCTRHKEKIEDCDYPRRCHKRRSALVPIACLQLVGSVLFLCTSSQGLQ